MQYFTTFLSTTPHSHYEHSHIIQYFTFALVKAITQYLPCNFSGIGMCYPADDFRKYCCLRTSGSSAMMILNSY